MPLQVGPDIVFSALLAFFVAFGTDPANPKMPRIVSVNEAAAGYGNSGLLTVMFLYTMAEGMTQTGGEPTCTMRSALIKMQVPEYISLP